MTSDSKKLIKRLVTFSVFLVATVLIFNYAYIQKVEYNTIFWRDFFELDEFLEKNNDLDYVFLGTSRTRDSLNPMYIPNSVNLSLAHQNYILAYKRLKYYLKRYDLKIDNIVLEIDDTSLTSRFTNVSQLANFDKSQFFSKKELCDLSGMSMINVLIRSNFPFVGRAFEAYGYVRTKPMELYLGWAKELGDFSKNPMDIEKTVELIGKDYVVDETTLSYFKKTILLAKENNINIILLKNPHAQKYRELLDDYGVDLSSYYNKINKEVASLEVDYKVLDYYEEFADRPEYFHIDASHVNYRGAEVLSKKFIDDMNAIAEKD